MVVNGRLRVCSIYPLLTQEDPQGASGQNVCKGDIEVFEINKHKFEVKCLLSVDNQGPIVIHQIALQMV